LTALSTDLPSGNTPVSRCTIAAAASAAMPRTLPIAASRVEAACIPSNAPSIRVLEKCGFDREGLARRYLCINGVWQDHLLFGLLHEDFRG
jgi:[ribosomal protein S5]-alanine N-acetyltransferase